MLHGSGQHEPSSGRASAARGLYGERCGPGALHRCPRRKAPPRFSSGCAKGAARAPRVQGNSARERRHCNPPEGARTALRMVSAATALACAPRAGLPEPGNDPPETRVFDRGDCGKTAESARTSLDQEIRAARRPAGEFWALQPPSRSAKCSKWLNLAAARTGKTIALAAITTPRFSTFVSSTALLPRWDRGSTL